MHLFRARNVTMSFLEKMIGSTLKILSKIVAASPRLRALLYDLRNREEFGDLYEHEKMLADTVRTDTYKKAIQKHIGHEDVVLDLGTGTGILSFFAAKQNAKKVYAIDHSDFIDMAQKIARHNNLDNIEFVKTNSRDFKTKIKFDVIIHEQIGDYLFNENMVQNLLDLKRRILKTNGKILPGRFELFLEPVSLREEFNIPYIWENKSYGIDFTILKEYYEELEKFQPPNYFEEWLDADAVTYFLCDPSPILFFDLNMMSSEKEIPRSIQITKRVKRSGTLNGFCLYFNVIFDDEISFDTSPVTENTHWGNCLFRLENRRCMEGEVIQYTFTMQDLLDILTWSVSKPRFKKKKGADLGNMNYLG